MKKINTRKTTQWLLLEKHTFSKHGYFPGCPGSMATLRQFQKLWSKLLNFSSSTNKTVDQITISSLKEVINRHIAPVRSYVEVIILAVKFDKQKSFLPQRI